MIQIDDALVRFRGYIRPKGRKRWQSYQFEIIWLELLAFEGGRGVKCEKPAAKNLRAPQKVDSGDPLRI
jgi:hypothetical protein